MKSYYQTNSATKSTNHPLVVEGNVITDDAKKAELINNFFVEQTKLQSTDRDLPVHHPLQKENISMININSSKVTDQLNILKTSKATGPDGLNPQILKRTAKEIAPSLTKIFNFSIRTSEFPSTWKTAQVTPLFKGGDQSLIKKL